MHSVLGKYEQMSLYCTDACVKCRQVIDNMTPTELVVETRIQMVSVGRH